MKGDSAPRATYRLQLTKDFRLQEAAAIAAYLRDLNISHLYLSPVLSAVPGSTHGYDVLDFSQVSAERGGEEGLTELCGKLEYPERPLRLLLDIVPNHMSAATINPYWRDVLARGPHSPYRMLFDLKINGNQKIKLPVLSANMDKVLKNNEIKLGLAQENPVLFYFEKSFPLNQKSLEKIGADFQSSGATDFTSYLEKLPVSYIAGILQQQYYELVSWTDIEDSISYRRFFNITDLIGVRVEEENNYRISHETIFRLLKEFPAIEGVRVDHIDGLADPTSYLQRLKQKIDMIWVEKILSRDEDLPAWPVKGTTGYEFIDRLNQLFIHRQNFERIQNYWHYNVQNRWENFLDCVLECKIETLELLFPAELKRLCVLSAGDTVSAKEFWTGMTTRLDVYRTYGTDAIDDKSDQCRIANAAAKAAAADKAFAAARDLFMQGLLHPDSPGQKAALREWQQLSGPVMAKGLEDKAHYRFTPLAALNEVGCHATITADETASFAAWIQERSHSWPLAMNATTTHDTKRNEDVRHRLYALADMPNEWFKFFESASSIATRYNPPASATIYFLYQALLGIWPFDNRIDQDFTDRIIEYMKKSVREAGVETNWLHPAEDYEENLSFFIKSILQDKDFITLTSLFAARLSYAGAINSLAVQTVKILSPGLPDIYQGTESWNFSLVDPDNRRPVDYKRHAKLLAEAAAFDDHHGRHALLRHLSETWQSGAIKIWLTAALLQIRRNIFQGSVRYQPVQVEGARADHIIAWRLTSGWDELVIVCPRYAGLFVKPFAALGIDVEGWEDTRIILDKKMAESHFTDLLTKQSSSLTRPLFVKDILRIFPVAVFSIP